MTDAEILATLGSRLRALRRAGGLSQEEAAARAGVSRSTVQDAEGGENSTLLTLIHLLRVYGRLPALDAFIPEPELSPMARLRERRRGRRGGDPGDPATRPGRGG